MYKIAREFAGEIAATVTAPHLKNKKPLKQKPLSSMLPMDIELETLQMIMITFRKKFPIDQCFKL